MGAKKRKERVGKIDQKNNKGVENKRSKARKIVKELKRKQSTNRRIFGELVYFQELKYVIKFYCKTTSFNFKHKVCTIPWFRIGCKIDM